MKLPNKVFSFEQSILAPIPSTLTELDGRAAEILELYLHVHQSFPHIGPQDFADMLSVLYVLDAIDIDSHGKARRAR